MKNLITYLVLSVLSGTALADSWTVDDDGKADFNNIQAAVDAASDGDVIVVSPGTYTGTGDQVVDMLGKAVTLRSTDPDDPDVVVATVIDGESTRRGLACFNAETNKTVIAGFTITNGFGFDFDFNSNDNIEDEEAGSGGGMCNYYSSPTLTSCTFTNNSAINGGGIYNHYSNPTLTNCSFESNIGNERAAGMYNGESSPSLTNCTFENCNSGIGGAMSNLFNSDPILTQCTFTNNEAVAYGGGMYNYGNTPDNGCNPTLTDCTFENNYGLYGGGMFNWGGNSNPILENCVFTNNSSLNGGGMYNLHSTHPMLTACTFSGNTATSSPSGSGGGMYNGVGSSSTLTGCNFTNNTSGYMGGGIYCEGSSPTLTDCTFTENNATYGGAIISSYSSHPSITNCTFTENTSDYYGGALYAGYDSNPTLEGCAFVGNTGRAAGAVLWNSNSTINNCTFTGNTAVEDGGAVATVSYDPYSLVGWDTWLPKLNNCEFDRNIAGSRGGALLIQGHAYLKDCAFTSNETEIYTDDLDCWEGGGAMFVMYERTVTLENCSSSGNNVPNGGGQGIQTWFNQTFEFIGDNSIEGIKYGDCELINLSLYMEAESVIHLENDLILPPDGVTSFDIHNIATTPSLVVDGELAREGCLSVTNESGSLMEAQAGDTIQLMQAQSHYLWFSSLIFPLLPDGLGMEFWGDGTTLWAKIVEIVPAEFDDPLTADLNEPPIEIVDFDPDGDGVDDIVMLFGGDVDRVVAYSVSEDAPPEPIEELYADVLDGSVDVSAADLDNDGLDDLLIVNGLNHLMTICTTSNASGSPVFDVSHISVPGAATDTITCVAAIDWDGDSDLDAVVGIDVADLPGPDGTFGTPDDITSYDGYRVLLDIASDATTAGPWLVIDLFDTNPTEVELLQGDPPTSVAQGNDGFVGGTRYGRVHQGSSGSNELDVLGELSGKNVYTLKTKDLNDDGLLDIMLTSNEAESIYLLEGDSDEPNGYGELIPILVSDPVEDITAFDADGDGDTDLFYTSPQSDPPLPLIVLRNDSPLGFRAQTLKGITWSKQTAGSSAISPARITSGGLSGKDDLDDWVTGAGSSSSNIRGEPGVVMEQINIRLLASCPSDFNGDDIVDVNDLLILIADWGTCTDNCNSDLNDDGEVDVSDLLILIAAWGPCP